MSESDLYFAQIEKLDEFERIAFAENLTHMINVYLLNDFK